MAADDLLPYLSSGDDDDEGEATSRPPSKKQQQEQEESDDDEYEIDNSFQFGGILGEDGGLSSSSYALLQQSSSAVVAGWSYQSALNRIEQQQNSRSNNGNTPVVPRMDVASLIAAKRKTFQSTAQPTAENHEQREKRSKTSDEDSNDNNDEGSEDSDDSDSDDEEPPVDDSHKGMEEDLLKTRIEKASGKQTEKEHKNARHDYDDNGSESGDSDDVEEEDGNEEEETEKDGDDNKDDDKVEAAKAAAYFDNEPEAAAAANVETIEVFAQLTLSRPLLRGVAAMGFVQPTPIQAAVIPLAMQGRDICASAVTGSGKTAAFLLPILERLLHRHGGRTKAIILTPTRELAAQCVGMLESLAQFCKNIRACLIVGGSKDVNSQAAELRTRPEVVVATPGRLLDHVTNTPGFSIESVEFLVLDEADRLLDLGFTDEVHEIIKSCPVQRQTLLFSATMNTNVDELVKLSLKRPVRIRIKDSSNNNAKDMEVAPRLEQEFVRVRAGNEGINREGMLLALLSRTFSKQTIVFFDTKVNAHRMMILCGLCGIKCAELHGNLTQKQRLQALEDFRQGQVDVLLATDLAARGLDIDRVSAVINFEMPNQLDTYIHRIGRTARAGRGGQSCTLIGEGRRYLMKELIKDAEAKTKKRQQQQQQKKGSDGVIRSRTIPAAVVSHFVQKIQSLEQHVEEVLQAEAVARMDRLAEMEVSRAQNIIEHADEINARPAREWFVGNKQKETTKRATAAERKQMYEDSAGTGTHRMNRKKRRAREAMEALNAPDDDGGDDGNDGDGKEKSRSSKIPSVKSAARAHKKKVEEEDRESRKRTLHDQDVYHEQQAEKKKKQKKAKTGKDALGDSGLFAEDEIFHAPKRQQEAKAPVAKSSYNFRGHDPDKKLGKKKGNKAFKSKSKYKRRK